MTPPRSWEAGGKDWAKVAQSLPAGTGPFRLSGFVPQVSAELTRNGTYWDAERRPHVDRVVFLPIPEATTRMAALQAGKVSWNRAPPPPRTPALRASRTPILTDAHTHTWVWRRRHARPHTRLWHLRAQLAFSHCLL